MIRKTVACLLLAALGGCATPTRSITVRQNIIAVTDIGAASDPAKQSTTITRQQLDEQIDGIFTAMDAYFAARPAGEPHKILIFVHGGLNPPDQSLDAAMNEIPQIKQAGFFPIFINWNSALGDTYVNHVANLDEGETSNFSWKRVALTPFFFVADVGAATFRLPVTLLNEWGSDYDSLSGSYVPNVEFELVGPATQPTQVPTVYLGGQYVMKPHRVAAGLSYAITALPKWLIVTPLIDCFGTPAFSGMSRRTLLMYDGELGSNPLFSGPPVTNVQRKSFLHPGAVEVFRERLLAKLGDGPNSTALDIHKTATGHMMIMQPHIKPAMAQPATPYEVTLIGHSMGTMVLNEWLRRDVLEDRKTVYHNIVYMAAACTVRDFGRSIIPYLKAHRGETNFYSLMLHPLAELREKNVYDLTPRGSLLVWLDDFLTTPQTPLDRTLGRWDNLVPALSTIPDDIAGQITFRAFALAPSSDPPAETGQPDYGPQAHGQFRDMRYWDWHLWDWRGDPTNDHDVITVGRSNVADK